MLSYGRQVLGLRFGLLVITFYLTDLSLSEERAPLSLRNNMYMYNLYM